MIAEKIRKSFQLSVELVFAIILLTDAVMFYDREKSMARDEED